MRALADAKKTKALFEYLGKRVRGPGRLYVTGGATALLIGWRDRTVDVDCKLEPEPPGIFEAIQQAKIDLDVNIELASPDLFIPPLPGWQDRSVLIGRFGQLEVYHFDFYSQALSKIQRGLPRDAGDVAELLSRRLVEPAKLRQLFQAIEPNLMRYPAIDAAAFRAKLDAALATVKP